MGTDLLVFALTLDTTNEEIVDSMRQAREWRLHRRGPVVATIAGFGSDPRELYEMPEVRGFCRRLIDSGFISYLDYWPSLDSKEAGPLGSVEIILIAECKGKMPYSVDVEDLKHFEAVVLASNTKADSVCGPLV